MSAYELLRRVSVGPLTIRLWIDADDAPCEFCEETADEVAMCASALADEEDEPIVLAEKLANTLRGLVKVEVVDAAGNGGLVYPEHP
jgi:hypothetical protein